MTKTFIHPDGIQENPFRFCWSVHTKRLIYDLLERAIQAQKSFIKTKVFKHDVIFSIQLASQINSLAYDDSVQEADRCCLIHIVPKNRIQIFGNAESILYFHQRYLI